MVSATYSTELDDLQLRVWEQALGKYDEGRVLDALLAHIKNPDRGRFPPKPADLIGWIRDQASPTGVNPAAYRQIDDQLPSPKALSRGKSSSDTGRHYGIVMDWLSAGAKNPAMQAPCEHPDQQVRESWLYVANHWRDHGSSLDWKRLMRENKDRIDALIAATETPEGNCVTSG